MPKLLKSSFPNLPAKMNDQDYGLIGELLNLFYREQYEAQAEKNEDLESRIHNLRINLETERDRTRLLQTQIELLRSELMHMDEKFQSYMMVFDRIFHYEGENVRDAVKIYIDQVHSVYGYMDDVYELMAEYETDPEFDLLMETLVEDTI